MEKRQKWCTLGAVFLLTLLVAGLVPLCMLIDYNTRRTVYGTVNPAVTFSLEEGVPTLTDPVTGEGLFSLPATDRQRLVALCPPGVRAWMALLRGEWMVAEKAQPPGG